MSERSPSLWRKFLAINCIAFSHLAADAAPPIVSYDTLAATPARSQSSEERLWKIAVDSDKAGAYDAYLRKYPNGRYAVLARSRIASIVGTKNNGATPAKPPEVTPNDRLQQRSGLSAEDELWKAATETGKPGDYQAYLREYPQGRYAEIARNQLGTAALMPGAQAAVEPEFRTNSSPSTTIRFGDQTMTGNFTTDPQSGKVSGTGQISWTNGNRFEGTLVRGVKQGKGMFSWNNGQRYVGDWANDLPNGKGTIIYANGDRYDGDVKDGQAHGQGTARFTTGDSYAGNWVGGRRHGNGRYLWVQGSYWEGEFKNGERTENGALTRAPGSPQVTVNDERPAHRTSGGSR